MRAFTGISTTSLLLELFSYTVMALYNYTYQYALLSYLEYPILLVQEVRWCIEFNYQIAPLSPGITFHSHSITQQYILVGLVFKYKKMLNQNNMTCVGAYWIIVLLFAYQICPRFLLSMAVVSACLWLLCWISLNNLA